MKVSIDPSAGFCWGVVRTIDIAEQELKDGHSIVSLGDIIHNPEEIERMKSLGMSAIHHEDMAQLSKFTKVLIRAHGEPPKSYRLTHELGLQVVDATCPVVTKLQERIRKFYDDGYQIVIFGKKEHAEVIGLRGVCNDDCIIVKSLAEAKGNIDLTRKTVLFSQTTMDKPTFYAIKEYLQSKTRELVIDSMENIAMLFHAKDTICGQVSGREATLREFAKKNDVIIFVAGKKSSNGKVLYDICKDTNPKTHFIETIDNLTAQMVMDAELIGISGATSTPQWLMEAVKNKVEEIVHKNARATHAILRAKVT